jgi:hypothetical protein
LAVELIGDYRPDSNARNTIREGPPAYASREAIRDTYRSNPGGVSKYDSCYSCSGIEQLTCHIYRFGAQPAVNVIMTLRPGSRFS